MKRCRGEGLERSPERVCISETVTMKRLLFLHPSGDAAEHQMKLRAYIHYEETTRKAEGDSNGDGCIGIRGAGGEVEKSGGISRRGPSVVY